MTKHKNINLKINQKHVSTLLVSLLTAILRDHQNKLHVCASEISQAIQIKSKEKVLLTLKDLANLCENTINELNDAAPMVLEMEELVPSETEVLEDLPDLEEDSLGVGSGGE